jgi:hypothetical protein
MRQRIPGNVFEAQRFQAGWDFCNDRYEKLLRLDSNDLKARYTLFLFATKNRNIDHGPGPPQLRQRK